ncbi:MAG: hypothetical protein QOF78_2263 [Phycisphaerales bacterium]|nr:hypothetical protein [Phycisphaerales bacterium]
MKWIAAGIIVVVLSVASAGSASLIDNSALRNWGMETYNEIERTLRVPGTALYAERANLDGTRSGGAYGRSYVWADATQFRVLNTLTRIDSATYAPKLRQFSDQLHSAYWDNGYRSAAGPSTRFYDDNGHVVVALVEAYNLTGDSVYLNRAVQTQAFVLSGEDALAGGGIYFSEDSHNGKDAISTLQGARGAAMLYRATGQQQYFNDATRLLDWANTHIQRADGLYYQNFGIASNAPGGVPLANSAGISILTNLDLYQATGQRSYLIEAERIATRTVTYHFNNTTGRINDPGYWAFELADSFDEMTRVGENPYWREKLNFALHYLHDNKRDPNGHYGDVWGGAAIQTGVVLDSWKLIDQAAVAQAYLNTSINPEPSGAVLCAAGLALLLRRARRCP